MGQTLIEWTWRRVPRASLSMSQLEFALNIDAVADGATIHLPGYTFNPWIGCTKVSPGCLHCYAAALDLRRFSKTLGDATKKNPIVHWGKGAPRWRTSPENWRKPFQWNAHAQKLGVRLRVFSSSLADWLDNEVPIVWLADFLAVIASTPALDWILVTKRPENWRSRLEQVRDGADFNPAARSFAAAWLGGGVWQNVWFIVSTEDQERAEKRVPLALDIPAIVHGVSAEPLLGPIDFTRLRDREGNALNALTGVWSVDGRGNSEPGARLNWVIVGGESGDDDKAPDGEIVGRIRPMRLADARAIRDQTLTAGAAFFFKQWGEWLPFSQFTGPLSVMASENPNENLWPNAVYGLLEPDTWAYGVDDPDADEFDPDDAMSRVGVKSAGKCLDGVEYIATPEPKIAA